MYNEFAQNIKKESQIVLRTWEKSCVLFCDHFLFNCQTPELMSGSNEKLNFGQGRKTGI